MPTNPTDAQQAVERATHNYIEGRGGHGSQCCFFRLGYGCNCQVAEWESAFSSGYRAALGIQEKE